jgi:uncharacterized membrane protein
MLKKLFKEGYALVWTVSGTALVLITLSGEVLKYALWISGASIVAHMIGFVLFGGEDDES